MSKTGFAVSLCVAAMVLLSACSQPVDKNPYESLAPNNSFDDGGSSISTVTQHAGGTSATSSGGKIRIGSVKLTENTVSIEVKNITWRYETEQGSHFEYTCYDENGEVLTCDTMLFGRIHRRQSRTCEFIIPNGTKKVEFTKFAVEYWTDVYA